MPRPNDIAADARALYGPLENRPAASDMGDGALWVDPGAGHALYQVQSGNWVTISPGESAGTVTRVDLSAPAPLSASGGPISASGTLALAWATGQTANEVLASPNGSSGAVSLRALAAGDLPSLDAAKIGSGTLALARLSGLTHSQLDSAAGLLGSQLDAAAGILAAQIASVNPSALTGSGTVPRAALPVVPAVRAYNSSTLSVNNTTFTTVPLTSTRYDQGTDTAQHSNATNTSRLTCQAVGIYHITAQIGWPQVSPGTRWIVNILLNGATVIARDERDQTAGFPTVCFGTDYSLAVNDYVEMQVYQDSGSAQTITAQANFGQELSMVRVG